MSNTWKMLHQYWSMKLTVILALEDTQSTSASNVCIFWTRCLPSLCLYSPSRRHSMIFMTAHSILIIKLLSPYLYFEPKAHLPPASKCCSWSCPKLKVHSVKIIPFLQGSILKYVKPALRSLVCSLVPLWFLPPWLLLPAASGRH
jgi:hypothetical protein